MNCEVWLWHGYVSDPGQFREIGPDLSPYYIDESTHAHTVHNHSRRSVWCSFTSPSAIYFKFANDSPRPTDKQQTSKKKKKKKFKSFS